MKNSIELLKTFLEIVWENQVYGNVIAVDKSDFDNGTCQLYAPDLKKTFGTFAKLAGYFDIAVDGKLVKPSDDHPGNKSTTVGCFGLTFAGFEYLTRECDCPDDQPEED